MTALFKLTLIDIKLYLRNFVSLFFTLVFPLLMLFLFGSMYGNEPSPFFGGHGSMDVTIPGYIATIIIGTTAFMSLPSSANWVCCAACAPPRCGRKWCWRPN
jgi:ABC-2 type transport system permease protein